MAGDWLKWTKGLTRRREVLGIASRLNVTPANAAGLCMMFWEWLDDNVAAAQIDENGNACVTLGALQPDFIDSLVCASGFAAALTAEGWLCPRSGSLTVPNYCRHNGQTSKDRALTAERVAKTRSRDSQKCNGRSVTDVTVEALPEKRREEKTESVRPFDATDHFSIWPDAIQLALKASKTIWPFSPPKPMDRELLKKAAFLALTLLSEDWLQDAIEGTRLTKPRNPAAYLKKILTEGAKKSGYTLNSLLDSFNVPTKGELANDTNTRTT